MVAMDKKVLALMLRITAASECYAINKDREKFALETGACVDKEYGIQESRGILSVDGCLKRGLLTTE